MTRSLLAFAFGFVALSFSAALGEDKPKGDDKKQPPVVGALAPNPLDGAFKGRTIKEFDEGLLNNDQYKKAVAAALKAKQDQEDFYKKNPKAVGPSPEQAARRKFLEVLTGQGEDKK